MDDLDTGEFEMNEWELDAPPVAPALLVAEAEEDLPLLDEGDFVFVGWTYDI